MLTCTKKKSTCSNIKESNKWNKKKLNLISSNNKWHLDQKIEVLTVMRMKNQVMLMFLLLSSRWSFKLFLKVVFKSLIFSIAVFLLWLFSNPGRPHLLKGWLVYEHKYFCKNVLEGEKVFFSVAKQKLFSINVRRSKQLFKHKKVLSGFWFFVCFILTVIC